MGVTEANTWVLVRRYDKLESETEQPETSLMKLTLTSGSMPEDVKALIFQLINVEDDGTRVLKIRRPDNNLVPLSTLLNGSKKEKPFLIDVVAVHQFCSVQRRSVPPGYIEALKSKFNQLETRIALAEQALPKLTTDHIQMMEDATEQLANRVSFLNRRLDELAPPDWRNQIQSSD